MSEGKVTQLQLDDNGVKGYDGGIVEAAVHEGHVPDKEELEGSNHPPELTNTGFLRQFLFEGGTKLDAFLAVAAAQVGQVMLTLPHSLAETGMIPGIIFQVTCALTAIWTLYLLVVLYLDFKNRKIKAGEWYQKDGSGQRGSITQYHEIISGLCGKWAGRFTLFIIIVTSVGTCLPQIVASSTNMYRVSTALNKRSYELIYGGAMVALSTVVPSFRNVRLFTFYALLATTWTTWYMMGASIGHGLSGKGSVWTKPPQGGLQGFFDGFTNILFTFGGHYYLIDMLDANHYPGKFHTVFAKSYPYILHLTLPNAILTYWAFPDTTILYGNAFGIYNKDAWRTVTIFLMIGHQTIAFMLFILPLLIMWEKLIKTHNKPWYIRLPSRLPVSLFILFIAVAFPFYTVINGFLGAFTTTFETFAIPTLAYNFVYWTSTARDNCPKPPNFRIFGKYQWQATMTINFIIAVLILIFGGGFGIWAAVKDFIASINTFGVFAKCYEC